MDVIFQPSFDVIKAPTDVSSLNIEQIGCGWVFFFFLMEEAQLVGSRHDGGGLVYSDSLQRDVVAEKMEN